MLLVVKKVTYFPAPALFGVIPAKSAGAFWNILGIFNEALFRYNSEM
jgi:hypothetical protein